MRPSVSCLMPRKKQAVVQSTPPLSDSRPVFGPLDASAGFCSLVGAAGCAGGDVWAETGAAVRSALRASTPEATRQAIREWPRACLPGIDPDTGSTVAVTSSLPPHRSTPASQDMNVAIAEDSDTAVELRKVCDGLVVEHRL